MESTRVTEILMTMIIVIAAVIAVTSGEEGSVQLGKSCTERGNCSQAFTECKDGKCQCVEGTEEKDSVCEIAERNCPYGKPYSTNNRTIVTCIPPQSFVEESKKHPDPGFLDENGTCPASYYCQGELSGTYNGNFLGFCCPKQRVCPVGVALKNVTCQNDEVSDQLAYCPQDTHYCFSAAGSYSVCCPQPCLTGQYVKDGQCHQYKALGASCSPGDQCEGDRVCKHGKCSCAEGMIDSDGSCYSTFCSVSNKPNAPTLTALNNSDGQILRCNANVSCPTDAYCTTQNYCCPVPEPYCTQTCSAPSKVVTCDAYGSNQCGGDSCSLWYNKLGNVTDDGSYKTDYVGFCCPTQCMATVTVSTSDSSEQQQTVSSAEETEN